MIATIEKSELSSSIEAEAEQIAEIVDDKEQTATIEKSELIASIEDDKELNATTEC